MLPRVVPASSEGAVNGGSVGRLAGELSGHSEAGDAFPSSSSLSGSFWIGKPSFIACFRASPASFGRRPWRRRRSLPPLGPRVSLPPLSLSSSRFNLGRPSRDQRPRRARTPSGAILLKSPPKILNLHCSPRPGRNSRILIFI